MEPISFTEGAEIEAEIQILTQQNTLLQDSIQKHKERASIAQSHNAKQEILKKRIVQLVSLLSTWGIPIPPIDADKHSPDEQVIDEVMNSNSFEEGVQVDFYEKENEMIRQNIKNLEKDNSLLEDENEAIENQINQLQSTIVTLMRNLTL